MTRTIKAYFQTILILLSLAACTNPVPQIDEDSDVAIIVDAAVDSRSDRAQDDSADAAEAAVEASVDDSDASATEDSDASGDAQDGGNQRDSQADAVVMDGLETVQRHKFFSTMVLQSLKLAIWFRDSCNTVEFQLECLSSQP